MERVRAAARRANPDTVAAVKTEEPPWEEEEQPRRRNKAAARPQAAEEPDLEEEDGNEESVGQESVLPQIFIGRKKIRENRPLSDNHFFKWSDNGETQVVRFLPGDPWSYNQHWVTRAGKQSFPCIGKDCPLCNIGSKVTQKIVYPLLNLSVADGPVVQTLEVTQSVDDILVAFDTDKKTGPLSNMWYALSRTKKARSTGFGNYNYHILPIKDRDLEEDHEINLDDAEDAYDKAEAPDPMKVLGTVDRKTLQDIADEAMA